MGFYCKIILLLTLVYNAKCVPKLTTENTCGYQSCHPVNPDKITVHLVPHSHNDVGWIKTLDQYYFGTNQNISTAGVQYIIGSYTQALHSNRDRRFIQVETAFFWKWWNQQNEETKNIYRDLINRGQIEMINGAWSMNDEGATNYQSIIDQFTWGLRMINDSLGECAIPKIGWQIDPFGHSREMASMYYRFGYDGFFVGRLDWRDKSTRQENKTIDFIWKGSANDDKNFVFGNILLEFYTSPENFCFDIECKDEPLNDDKESSDYNVVKKVEEFAKNIEKKILSLKTKNVLIPMGGDFQYQAAEANFINIDKLIKGFQDFNSDIELIYSTPSCYLKAVNEGLSVNQTKLAVKTNDFFPYASDPHAFWSGYFSSRPTSKRFERIGNNILQAAKQLASFDKILLLNKHDYDKNLINLREAMGVMQHHDAITGTEKTAVFKDYSRILNKAIREAEENVGNLIIDLMKKEDSNIKNLNLDLKTCLLANVTVCETSLWNKFVVAVYNPLGQAVNYTLEIPAINKTVYKVTGPQGKSVDYVIHRAVSTFDFVKEPVKPTGYILQFQANEVPPLGINLYYFEKTSSRSSQKQQSPKEDTNKFGTERTGFEIDPKTNLLKSVTMNGVTINVTQQFYYYNSAVGDNNVTDEQWDRRASGAYILRPNGTAKILTSEVKTVSSFQHNMFDEVHITYADQLEQIIKVYKNDDSYIEFEWVVGPLTVNEDEKIGKEVVMRLILPDNFDTKDVFYTDSNGREMLRRIINNRTDYIYDPKEEPVASNYYPVTSKIVVKDEERKLQLALLNDRAQGGAHLKLEDGTRVIELMVHRRILHDDDFGVAESLNEEEYGEPLVVRGQHYLIVGSTETDVDGLSTSAQERILAQKKLLQPWVLVGEIPDLKVYQDNLNYVYKGINNKLPLNVHLLTLESWKDDSCLVRLEHLLEKGEDASLSKPATVDLSTLVSTWNSLEFKETTLGANQFLIDFNKKTKFNWYTEDGETLKNYLNSSLKSGREIIIEPMEIRTFVVKIKNEIPTGGTNTRCLSFFVVIILYSFSIFL